MTTLSYSAIKTYEQCPLKYKLGRIDRLPEPSGPAAERGKRIHSELEAALKDGLLLLSDEIAHLADKLTSWKTESAQSEMTIAVNEAWESCDFKDKSATIRGIIDLYSEDGDTAVVLDFKSGKIRDYTDQVTVYATLIFACYPHINRIIPTIEFIDHKKTKIYSTINRSQFEELKMTVNIRCAAVLADTIYAPNPSFLCRWCHYRKDNGGPCKW